VLAAAAAAALVGYRWLLTGSGCCMHVGAMTLGSDLLIDAIGLLVSAGNNFFGLDAGLGLDFSGDLTMCTLGRESSSITLG